MDNSRAWFSKHRAYYNNNLKHICVNCGFESGILHLHHIVPLIKGGTNNLTNVVYLCEECHSKVHNINFKQHSNLTKEGIKKARLNGKQIGLEKGTKLTTKKSIESKKDIQKYSKDFNGTLKDIEVMKLIGLARNTYYKYKKELVQELSEVNR